MDSTVEAGIIGAGAAVLSSLLTAQGRPSGLERPEALTGDRWFAMQGQLRVFGSRPARDEFDAMMKAALVLQALETSAVRGQSAGVDDVANALRELRDHAAKLRTVVSAEVGPLRDLLDWRPLRWWQLRYWRAKRLPRAADDPGARAVG